MLIFSQIKIDSINSKIAPGIPNIPTITAVIKFIPICNPHIVPIMLIAYNKITPNIELIINFRIILIGTIKIFPIIIIPIIQATYINNILISIFKHIPFLAFATFAKDINLVRKGFNFG